MIKISVSQLQKRHGTLQVLNGIDLTVAQGEVAAIIGPSGGGKSTFLRCLNGLERIDSGQIMIAGLCLESHFAEPERRKTVRQIRQRVGMVFQQFHLFPHQTVLENVVEAPIHVLKQSRSEAETEARNLLARVGLGDKLRSYPRQLSGGQQQRVAIARALAMHPEIILFDEPTSALDPRMAAEVLEVISDLAGSGQTMVVVTHSMPFARQLATTIHVFGEGRVVESGPPDQILENPGCETTRLFLNQAEAA